MTRKMKQFWKITICFLFVLTFANFAHSQTLKTTTGYFCGFAEGDGASLSIRVAGREKTFSIYGDEPDIKYVGFKKGRETDFFKLPVGTELIVSYVFKRPRGFSEAINIIRKLTLTGKINRKTKSCGFGLD
jgi:hypothetical protein